MNKRQKKKHLKKAIKLSLISLEMADRYLARYGLQKEQFKSKYYSIRLLRLIMAKKFVL